jgi:hypothetical protein
MTIAHDLPFDAVEQAKQNQQESDVIKDVRGHEVTVEPDDMIWINVAYRDEWVVKLSKHFYQDEGAAKRKMQEVMQELELPYVTDEEDSDLHWRYVVIADPEQFVRLRAAFPEQFEKGRPLHGVVRRQVSYSARWNQIDVKEGNLVIDAADPTFPVQYHLSDGKIVGKREHRVEVPRDSVLFISTSSPFKIPHDAMVLLVGNRPGESWYYLALYIVLGAFVVVNVVTLFMRLRNRKREEPS